MDSKTLIEIIEKLNGSVSPYGDHGIDQERAENLEQLLDVTDSLVKKIVEVAKFANRPEMSIQKMGIRANNYLADLVEEISGIERIER